jgi:hypothetical protein
MWCVFATRIQPLDPRRRETSSMRIFAGCRSSEIESYTRQGEDYDYRFACIVSSSSQVDSHTTMHCPGSRRHHRCIRSSDCCLRAQWQLEMERVSESTCQPRIQPVLSSPPLYPSTDTQGHPLLATSRSVGFPAVQLALAGRNVGA